MQSTSNALRNFAQNNRKAINFTSRRRKCDSQQEEEEKMQKKVDKRLSGEASMNLGVAWQMVSGLEWGKGARGREVCLSNF